MTVRLSGTCVSDQSEESSRQPASLSPGIMGGAGREPVAITNRCPSIRVVPSSTTVS